MIDHHHDVVRFHLPDLYFLFHEFSRSTTGTHDCRFFATGLRSNN
ncbi:unnamed protein product [Amoebophrya sp. A25]|nr:unnamed protein product [Amoebophrya sp. A25]|eukprot:GSA25T00019796001.1